MFAHRSLVALVGFLLWTFVDSVNAQCGYVGPGSPPGVYLVNLDNGSTIFAAGDHNGPSSVPETGPGTYTQSGTLDPGDYQLSFVTHVFARSPSGACDQIATALLQFDLGSPVVVWSSIRGAGATASNYPSNYTTNTSSNSSGAFDFEASFNAVYTHPSCPNLVLFSLGSTSIDLTVSGTPAAQTQWMMQADARGHANGSGFGVFCDAIGEGFSEFVDVFTVFAPTTYSITFTTTLDEGSGGWSQAFPILPSSVLPNGGFRFNQWPPNPPSQPYVDPPLAYGYSFEMLSADAFTQIVNFPVGIDADDSFIVTTGGLSLGSFSVGESVDFVTLTGSPVPAFEVYGIEPLVDGEDQVAFPIQLEFTNLTPDFTMIPVNMVPPTLYCFGDGSGTSCPCGNFVPPGTEAGCLHSGGVGGALTWSGVTSLLGDSLVLKGSDLPDTTALFFQGTLMKNGGAGGVFGDGLMCLAGTKKRFGTKQIVNGMVQYPESGDLPVSEEGLVSMPGVYTYQLWYRDPATFCTPQTTNLTNAIEVTWTP